MALSNLSSEEVDIVGQCLRAAALGPFFEDDEFETIMGVNRDEAMKVAARFPDVDEFDDDGDTDCDAWLVINNALVNLIGYPHGKNHAWEGWIATSVEDVKRIYEKWRGR